MVTALVAVGAEGDIDHPIEQEQTWALMLKTGAKGARGNRHWTADSWDQTQIPKPYADVAIAIGEPLDVPHGADDEAIERWRCELEARLRALESRAQAML